MTRSAIALLLVALPSLACATSDPPEIRRACYQRSIVMLRKADLSDEAKLRVQREMYLRCLDSYGVKDAVPQSDEAQQR